MRDILLRLAELDLYRPKWTHQINEEWSENLLESSDVKRENIERTIRLMQEAFPEALVTGYENLIDAVNLPDFDDRHILAAAIRCKADVIVTENVKDFPAEQLAQYDIERQTADEFITNLIDLDPIACCKALRNLLNNLTSPSISQKELLERFRKVKLKKSADKSEANC